MNIIKMSDADKAFIFYIDTTLNRRCSWISGPVAYADYQMYSYYRWKLRGELDYIPVVHKYTEDEYDSRLIDMMSAPGINNRGFKAYVHCIWDRQEPDKYSNQRQNTMNYIRWTSRGD